LFFFFFLGWCWHDIGLTPAAACTKCNLACIEPNTDFGLLFSSMNAKKLYEYTNLLKVPDC
jgi:hypothetical protein